MLCFSLVSFFLEMIWLLKADHRSGNLLILTVCVGRGRFVQAGVWECRVCGWEREREREGPVGMRKQCQFSHLCLAS